MASVHPNEQILTISDFHWKLFGKVFLNRIFLTIFLVISCKLADETFNNDIGQLPGTIFYIKRFI
jgi:hypothetical protein